MTNNVLLLLTTAASQCQIISVRLCLSLLCERKYAAHTQSEKIWNLRNAKIYRGQATAKRKHLKLSPRVRIDSLTICMTLRRTRMHCVHSKLNEYEGARCLYRCLI